MKQIVHIFHKDLRHHWPEIVVSLALLAAYAWALPSLWFRLGFVSVGPGTLAGFLTLLVPVAWCFLIVRIVQSESLVGDRQFWITRPYEWPKLLAAKILLVIIFVDLPLLGAQLFLLARAGFHPVAYLPEILLEQVVLAAFVLVPVAALGTVTSTIGQLVLAVLAVFLYIIGLLALASFFPSNNLSIGASAARKSMFVVYIAVAVAVIVWQYARRRTAAGRWLLVAAAIAIVIIGFAMPYQTALPRQYRQPVSGRSLPVQFSLGTVPAHPPKTFSVLSGVVHVPISLGVSGIAPGSVVRLDGTRVTMEDREGLRWNSGWQLSFPFLLAGQKTTHVDLSIKRSFLARVRRNPVKLRLEFALTTFVPGRISHVIVPEGEFKVRDVGICSVDPANPQNVYCRRPVGSSRLVLVSTPYSASTCSARSGQPAGAGLTAYAMISWRGSPALISPVKHLFVLLADWEGDSTKNPYPGACPGTPLTFATLQKARQVRSELEINNFRLPPIRQAGWKGKVPR